MDEADFYERAIGCIWAMRVAAERQDWQLLDDAERELRALIIRRARDRGPW